MTGENKNKNTANLLLQNAIIVFENFAAPIFGEDPSHLYPELRIVNNTMPISSNLSESAGKDSTVGYLLGNVFPIFC